LRASVGSTEASASLPARVGVVGPTRARPLQGQAWDEVLHTPVARLSSRPATL